MFKDTFFTEHLWTTASACSKKHVDRFALLFSVDYTGKFKKNLASKDSNVMVSHHLLMVCTKGKFTANDYQKKYLPTSNSLLLEHTKSIWLIPYYFVVSVYLFSGFVILHYEVDTLKSSLYKISRKRDFVDKCIKKL